MVGYFSGHVCIDYKFRCENHKCIYFARLCDGYDNCGDGSDEKNCSGKDVFHFSILSYVYLMFNEIELLY